MNSLPKTVTRQRRDCDLNLGPSVPKSSTLTTQHLQGENLKIATHEYRQILALMLHTMLPKKFITSTYWKNYINLK